MAEKTGILGFSNALGIFISSGLAFSVLAVVLLLRFLGFMVFTLDEDRMVAIVT